MGVSGSIPFFKGKCQQCTKVIQLGYRLTRLHYYIVIVEVWGYISTLKWEEEVTKDG